MSKMRDDYDGTYIYFVDSFPLNGIKIGCSRWPEERLRAIQAQAVVPLQLLGFVPGTLKHERAVHLAFSSRRMYGEWFASHAVMRGFIKEIIRLGHLPRDIISNWQMYSM